MRATGLGAAFISSLALSIAAPACLDDLDEPLTCLPPPEKTGSAASCLGAIGEDTSVFDAQFCLVDPNVLSCYREPSLGCDCDGRCSEATDVCHPPPDCPPEVLEAYPDAKCIGLGPDDLGPFQTEADQCLCGCEECILACDGRGPIWTQADFVDPDTGMLITPAGIITIDVTRHFPDAGKAGVYIRARGLTAGAGPNAVVAAPAVLVVRDDLEELESIGLLPELMNDRFEAELFPVDDLVSWTNEADKPTLLGLSNQVNAFSLYEIDCIVPFVVD